MTPRDARNRANEAICRVLQDWNLTPQHDALGVICGLGPLRANCTDVQISHGGKMASLLVDLTLDPALNLTLRENVMQIADDSEKAIDGAAYIWAFSVFVSVAAWLNPTDCPGHLAGCSERTYSTANGEMQNRTICSSPFLMMGSSNEIESNRAQEAQSDYTPSTFPLIEPFLPELCTDSQILAIKTFLMDSGVGTTHGDCTVNGIAAPELLEALKTFEWPPGQGMRSLRQFHLLAPTDYALDMTIPTPQTVAPKTSVWKKLFRRH